MGEVKETSPGDGRTGQGNQPQEPVFEQAERKSFLKRILETRLSKKTAITAATVTTAASAVLGNFLGSKAEGDVDQDSTVITGGSVDTVQTIESHPTIDVKTIPGTNIPNPHKETPVPTIPATVSPTATKEAPTATPTQEKLAENPLFARYDALAGKITESNISSDVKNELLTQLEEYKTIESVQDQLMKAYLSELGPDGKTPALLYYSWPEVPGIEQNNQIFVLVNQNKMENDLRLQIDQLNESFENGKVQGVFAQINKDLTEKPGSGNGLYVGIDISPSEYMLLANPDSVPEVSFSNVTEDQKAEVLNLLSTGYASLRGNFEIRGITTGTSKTETLGDGKTVIYINFSNSGAVAHELGHALNLLQTTNALPPADFIHSAILAEKLLFDPQHGRQHGSLDQMGRNPDEIPVGLPTFTDSALDRLIHNFANTEFPNGRFLNGVSKFTLAGSGAKITQEKYMELTKTLPGNQKVFYEDLNAFIVGDKEILDQLAASSKYFEMHIAWFRENPQAYVNLAQKLSGIQFTHNYGKERATYYRQNESVLFNDSVFAVKLLSGDTRALDYLNSLDATERSLLLNDAVARLQMADQEYFADMGVRAIAKPENSAFVNTINYFQSLQEVFP